MLKGELIRAELAQYPKALWLSLTVITVIVSLPFLVPPQRSVQPISVAFVGNSITFVNDVPRLMEALSDYTLTQNSCLHGSQNLLSIMTKGNGMYKKWTTKNAVITESFKNYATIYDYGACSFPQLIFGHDENLSSENENGIYINDGKNPCFENPVYYEYLVHQYTTKGKPKWDYIVMNDQTKYPAVFKKRRRSLLVLKEVYLPIFLEANARPVFIVTHGYNVNATKLGDVSEFTSHLWYGYQLYAQQIAVDLPEHLQPLLVPSGLAFLTVYEEDYELWEQLFYVDGFHPSVLGTYLMTCCLFATIYNHMPDYRVAIPSLSSTTKDKDTDYVNYEDSNTDEPMAQLWQYARAMATGNVQMPYPTTEQAEYLYSVAERVTIRGHRPSTLWSNSDIASVEVNGSWYTIDGGG